MKSTRIDLIGKKYGKLSVVSYAGRYSNGDAKWECICDCGNRVFTKKSYLEKWQNCCKECHRRPYEDFTGTKVGNLSILKRIEDKKNKLGEPVIQWQCVCDCGNEVIRSSTLLRRGRCCCNACRKEKDHNLFWKSYKEIPITYWNSLKRNARIRNLEFEINEEYVWGIFEKQKRKCCLSGVDIKFSKTKKGQNTGETTASLDRIDSTKGYIKGNVQWVHKWINAIKYDFEQEEFIEWCRKVVDYQKNVYLSKEELCEYVL